MPKIKWSTSLNCDSKHLKRTFLKRVTDCSLLVSLGKYKFWLSQFHWHFFSKDSWIKCDDDKISQISAEDVLKLSGGGKYAFWFVKHLCFIFGQYTQTKCDRKRKFVSRQWISSCFAWRTTCPFLLYIDCDIKTTYPKLLDSRSHATLSHYMAIKAETHYRCRCVAGT